MENKMESLKENSGFRLWRDRKGGKIWRRKTADAGTRGLQDANVRNTVVVSGGGRQDIVSCQKNSGGEGQVTRVKILVKKENLEKVLQAIRANTVVKSSSNIAPAASTSLYLEECINAMKKRRANQVKLSCRHTDSDSSWRPALDSIPESRVA